MIDWIKNLFAPYRYIKGYPCDRDVNYTILEVEKGTRKFKFRGGYTVWYCMPEMSRCSTSLEFVLHQFGVWADYESKAEKNDR